MNRLKGPVFEKHCIKQSKTRVQNFKKTKRDLRRIIVRKFFKNEIQTTNVCGVNSIPIMDSVWIDFIFEKKMFDVKEEFLP